MLFMYVNNGKIKSMPLITLSVILNALPISKNKHDRAEESQTSRMTIQQSLILGYYKC